MFSRNCFILLLASVLGVLVLSHHAAHAAQYTAIGDSLTFGMGADDPDGTQTPATPDDDAFVPRVYRFLNAQGGSFALTNLGTIGAVAPNLANTPGVLRDQVVPAVNSKPNVVTLTVGGNDVLHMTGFNGDAETLPQFDSAYDSILAALRSASSKPFIIVTNVPDLSQLPAFASLSDDQKTTVRNLVIAVNNSIATRAAQYQVPVIDLFSDPNSTDPQNISSSDGFHPNARGYGFLAAKVTALLAAPQNGSLTPASAVNAPNMARQWTATYSDANGASDITLAALRIGGSGNSSVNSLLCVYNAQTNKLSIFNDAANALIGSVTPGTDTPLSNSQGTLNCKDVTTSTNGNVLTVNWNVSATGTFAGTKQPIWLYTRDAASLSDGYDKLGTWTISGNTRPSNLSVSPASATTAAGVEQFFTTTFTDPNGYKNLQYVTLRLGGSGTGSTTNNANAMICVYNVQLGKLYLFNDAGAYVPQAAFPNTNVVLSNSQGSLDCKRTVVTGNGTTLTIKWSVKAKATFAGSRSIALLCADRANLRDGYDTFGTWTITGASGVAASSGAFSTASASSAGITLKFMAALDATSAANPANYTLRINGVAVDATVEAKGASVVLYPAGGLSAGDKIEVAWQHLLDAKNRTLNGQTTLTVP